MAGVAPVTAPLVVWADDLPSDAGHVVMVAFVKESDDPVPDRERAISEAARAAHDYFLFVR